MTLLIRSVMTPSPHSIGHDQPLAAAHRLMRQHRIRHLPVLDRGSLVGIVSQRDLHFIETLMGVKAEEVQVAEAMTPDPFTVTPETPVARVAREMAENKYGSAVVVDEGAVVGVFTTVDALRALCLLLDEREAGAR